MFNIAMEIHSSLTVTERIIPCRHAPLSCAAPVRWVWPPVPCLYALEQLCSWRGGRSAVRDRPESTVG